MKLLLLFSVIASVASFAPPGARRARLVSKSTPTTPTQLRVAEDAPPTADSEESQLSKLKAKATDLLSGLNLDGVLDNVDEIVANTMDGGDGEFGSRGELYVAAQFGLLLCILIGGVPVVGNFLMTLLGPVLLLVGALTILLGVNGLGAALSPWPVPAGNQDSLKTDGVFGQVRHPIYAGLLAATAGLSVTSGSATRLLLTAVLWYVLDVKSNFEEEQLMQKYGSEYSEYQGAVKGKFFPDELLQAMPWTGAE
eukprot:CAMPEP_0194046430 /NCGR_PEP_ID=MMETSP0009_2-20130614/21098_1 /TAXON_ID=210454 /ORGANISM="Grammatophora oceanica, Strain CCMP 410" /LENGTH=252 /DNA_ID=CAMNT_0038691711 /DNA_START=33 /DNA_END=791 /DNA_ORIENTATION=+